MKLFILFLILIHLFVFCQPSHYNKIATIEDSSRISKKLGDSLLLLKDTIVLGNSTEGEHIMLFQNNKNKDSIINVNSYGEMGKIENRITFNNGLINVVQIRYTYKKPLSVDINVEIASEDRKSYQAGETKNKELAELYYQYYPYVVHLPTFKIEDNGVYEVTLREDDLNPRNDLTLQLTISGDSIIYKATAYQVYQNYLLDAFPVNKGKLFKLNYKMSLDSTQSAVLNKTHDFGIIQMNEETLQWQGSPYLFENFEIPLESVQILYKLP